MRTLTDTERLLCNYCNDERQAVALAPHCSLSANATPQDIENAVMLALVRAKEAVSGHVAVELISGQRRDLIRKLC